MLVIKLSRGQTSSISTHLGRPESQSYRRKMRFEIGYGRMKRKVWVWRIVGVAALLHRRQMKSLEPELAAVSTAKMGLVKSHDSYSWFCRSNIEYGHFEMQFLIVSSLQCETICCKHSAKAAHYFWWTLDVEENKSMARNEVRHESLAPFIHRKKKGQC